MASFTEIQDAVELGWTYYVEQLEVIRLKMVDGCFACTTNSLTCLSSAILALEYDIETETNTALTTRTYNFLLSLLANFNGAFTADPTVQTSGITVITGAGTILQTNVVFPGDGVSSYTFSELTGQNVLAVYRGTGTVLRVRNNAPDNEFAQFESSTGEIIVAYPFSDGESLWVEYKTEAYSGTVTPIPSPDIFIVNTGTTDTVFTFDISSSKSVVSVIDLDAGELDITLEYTGASIGGGLTRYTKTQAVPYLINHRHQVTTS